MSERASVCERERVCLQQCHRSIFTTADETHNITVAIFRARDLFIVALLLDSVSVAFSFSAGRVVENLQNNDRRAAFQIFVIAGRRTQVQ